MATARRRAGLTQELIFLDRDDDLASIKAKLEAAGADQVYLAIPRRAAVLRTPLEFRILARMAHETSSEIVLISDDGERRRMAREEGFRTKGSLRSVRHLMRPADARGIWLPGLVPDIPLPSFGALLAVLLVLGLGYVLNFYILPVMTVTLVPQTEALQRDLALTVDPRATSLDPATGTLPGRSEEVTFQLNGSAVVAGTRTVGKDKARGEVIFSNKGAAIVLPAGTIVESKSGQKFVTEGDTNVPAGARSVKATVVATDPGTGGNVGPGEIVKVDGNVPTTIGVTNQSPTTGGTDREGRFVADDDVKKLQDQLMQRAQDQALRQLQSAAGEGRTVPPQSVQLKVTSSQVDPPVGSDADQFGIHLSVRSSGTSFQNRDFSEAVSRMLLGNLGPDVRLAGDGPRIGTPEVVGVDGGLVKLKVRASATAVHDIDAATVANALSGKTVAQARTELQDVSGLAQAPDVALWPSWASRAYRVKVNVVQPDAQAQQGSPSATPTAAATS